MVADQITPSDEVNKIEHSVQSLSEKETREILTPFAFTIDKSLFGLTLASAWRRGFALLLDLLFIVLLSDTPSEFLAFVAAVSAYKLGLNPNNDRPKKYGWLRKSTRLISTIMVFAILISSLPVIMDKFSTFNNNEPNEEVLRTESSGIKVGNTELSVEKSIVFSILLAKTVKDVASDKCKTVDCWHEYLSKSIEGFAQLEIDTETAKRGIEDLVNQTKLTEDEKFFLNASLFDKYLLSVDELAQKVEQSNAISKAEVDTKIDELPLSTPDSLIKEPKPTYSIVKYISALINDMGLGFGWAAIYFTMFTAYWNGQTPGKKFLSIRVVQLDGTPLSVVDSFGRYGGYGAGIATGLIGFLQIFWDANRQGIHDKIASTVVIDLKR